MNTDELLRSLRLCIRSLLSVFICIHSRFHDTSPPPARMQDELGKIAVRLHRRVNIEEKVIKAEITPGSRFEGYEPFLVQDRREIPLHTNGSENDIRCYVTRHKISAGTRSDIGRDCRDPLLSLAKTCDKLGIAIWDHLGSRLKVVGHAIVEPLDHYVRAQLRPA
jgi:hypothetical protein